MRFFTLIASLAFVAVVSQVSGEAGESSPDLQEILGITDKELEERQALMDKIEELEIWGVLTPLQQERLRHAVLVDKKPPKTWVLLTTYDKIVDPKYANFLWRLVHKEPHTRNFFMNALPNIAHEDTLNAASEKSWFRSLTGDDQKELSRRILTARDVPEGFKNWKEAVNDDAKMEQWAKDNRGKIKASEESSASQPLQKRLGVSDEELKERNDLFEKMIKQEIWGVMTAVQQHRLRQAVHLDKKVPWAWNILTSYDKIIDPANANFLWRLTHLIPHTRNFFMNLMEPVPHEDILQTATRQAWFKKLGKDEQKEKSTEILMGKNIPEGYDSWVDAINSGKL